MLNRANVFKFIYICFKSCIMLNRNEQTEKPKIDVKSIKADREKVVKSNKIVKK